MMSTNVLVCLVAFGCSNALAKPMQPPVQSVKTVTDAEKISGLERSLAEDRKLLEQLVQKLDDPTSDYSKAEKEFKELDAQTTGQAKQLQKLQQDKEAAKAAALEKELKSLKKQWALARDRFNLAIKERKTIQEKTKSLREEIDRDQKQLNQLIGNPNTEPKTKVENPATLAPPVAPKTTNIEKPPVAKKPVTPLVTPVKAGVLTMPTPPEAQKSKTEPPEKEKKPSLALVQAKREAKEKNAAVAKADRKLKEVFQDKAEFDKEIQFENQLLEISKQKISQAQEAKNLLSEELDKKKVAGAPAAELLELAQKIADADARIQEGLRESRERQERIHELKVKQIPIQAEEMAALKELAVKQREAKKAEEKVADLVNPFSPRNMIQWLLDHGPKVLLIIFGMFLLSRIMSIFSRRVVDLMAKRGKRHSIREAENRAHTLTGVFRNFAALVIWAGGTLMLMDELGIPVVALMGGAAIFGLAIAFGAQNLIRDYFTGFMVLLEDQYGIDDVVKIGDVRGMVERITLRVTVLRDLEGTVHFIPNGTVATVSNMTHGWSRALFEIGVAYKENADEVMAILMELAHELRADPAFGSWILDDPKMLGVDAFSDSAIVIKFHLKTKPLKRWDVKRELLRRIKKRFDELGIEIPFPHRTVYHHHLPADEDKKYLAA